MNYKLQIPMERIARVIRRKTQKYCRKTLNQFRPTFTTPHSTLHLGRVFHFLNQAFIQDLVDEFPEYYPLVRKQAGDAANHLFDLLGSGPHVVKHGMLCPGFDGIVYPRMPEVDVDVSGDWLRGRINRTNFHISRGIWKLIGPDYVPIDWQLDFKSGYRWSELAWHQDIPIGTLAGVDIKVPWELSRMQHLPHLALAICFTEAGLKDAPESDRNFRELRNQILDFIATNPPGFGVNWVCTMDVAIRAVNLLIARDIALASGKCFDAEFEHVIFSSIRDHMQHIVSNLEWDKRYRGNHYLANVVGLLFGSVYLQSSKQVDAWLAFAVQELIAECGYQFNSDGSNFEGSVCYHRLSSEMLLWSFALLLNLPADKTNALHAVQRDFTVPRLKSDRISFYVAPGTSRESPVPPYCWARLKQAADFTDALTRPDGCVVQFGDNDSGRLLILGSGEQLRANGDVTSPFWSLDHGAFVAGVYALIKDVEAPIVKWDPASRIINALAGINGPKIGPFEQEAAQETLDEGQLWEDILHQFETAPDTSRSTSVFHSRSGCLRQDLEQWAFNGFGIYIFSGPNLYLTIRCGQIGLSGLGAHDHCDQLGIELIVDGQSLVRDPGTMVYTAAPDIRNTYRSASAHHVPKVLGREPADLTQGMFDLRNAKSGECLYFGRKGFIGRHRGYGSWVYRIIKVEGESITIHDFAEGDLVLTDPHPASLPFSQGYGRVFAGLP